MGGAAPILGFAGGVLGTLAGEQEYLGQLESLDLEQQKIQMQLQERARQYRQEHAVFQRKSDISYGDSVSSFAKAGVDLSESPLMVLNDQKNEFKKTLSDIKVSAENDIKLLRMGEQSVARQIDSTNRGKNLAWIGGMVGASGSFLSQSSKGANA